MAPYELRGGYYGSSDPDGPKNGMDYLLRLRDRYRNSIWLNPSPRPTWGPYWSQTYDEIARVFPMFPLSVEGIEEGMKKLLSR